MSSRTGAESAAGDAGRDGARRDTLMRILVWGGAACLWLLPLAAMQFSAEVDWDARDFALVAAMLLAVCGTFELGWRASSSPAYRAGFALAAVAGFLLVWVNLAVGMIGSERNPYNLWFGSVLATGVAGALLARFRAPGMVRALLATALAQTLVSGAALLGGSDPLGALLSSFWILFWLTSARFFHYAADAALPHGGQRLQVHALSSVLAMVLGGVLLAVMVGVEGEPGLLPLALIVAGAGWHGVTRYRRRRLGRGAH
jgi:hypothetical protein